MDEDLIPVTVKIRRELLEAIDAGKKIHGEGRSQFIRNAITDKLRKEGFGLSKQAHLAPDRKGVGGTPSHRTSSPKPIESASGGSPESTLSVLSEKKPLKSEPSPEKLLSSSSGGKVNAPTAEQLKKSGLSHAAATAASLGAHLANEHVLRGDTSRSGKVGKSKASGDAPRHPIRQPKHRVASPTSNKDEQVPDVAPENK